MLWPEMWRDGNGERDPARRRRYGRNVSCSRRRSRSPPLFATATATAMDELGTLGAATQKKRASPTDDWRWRLRSTSHARYLANGGACSGQGSKIHPRSRVVRALRVSYQHVGRGVTRPQPCPVSLAPLALSLPPSFRAVLDGGSECSEFNNGHAFFIRSRQSTSLLSPPLKTLTISSFPASSLSLFGILAVVSACCDFTPL